MRIYNHVMYVLSLLPSILGYTKTFAAEDLSTFNSHRSSVDSEWKQQALAGSQRVALNAQDSITSLNRDLYAAQQRIPEAALASLVQLLSNGLAEEEISNIVNHYLVSSDAMSANQQMGGRDEHSRSIDRGSESHRERTQASGEMRANARLNVGLLVSELPLGLGTGARLDTQGDYHQYTQHNEQHNRGAQLDVVAQRASDALAQQNACQRALEKAYHVRSKQYLSRDVLSHLTQLLQTLFNNHYQCGVTHARQAHAQSVAAIHSLTAQHMQMTQAVLTQSPGTISTFPSSAVLPSYANSASLNAEVPRIQEQSGGLFEASVQADTTLLLPSVPRKDASRRSEEWRPF